jgi:hypothetical protein
MAWVGLRRAEKRATRKTAWIRRFRPWTWRTRRLASLGGPRCSNGVFGVGLALAPAALAIGTVDFGHRDLVGPKMPGQPGPVAAGALQADELDGAEAHEPAQESPIARRRSREALHAEQGTSFVEGGRHVDVEMRVDPTGDPARD